MKRAIIVANGKMKEPVEFLSYLKTSTLIIAADGGVHNCKTLGLQPQVIIGDLDSMSSTEVTDYQQAGVKVVQYPTHKDETDLELALRYVMEQEFSDVIIIGGLGARWDMTIDNILLIAHPMFSGLKIHMLDGTQELLMFRAAERSPINGRPGDTISLIPLTGDVSGITTEGLEYPLKDETLYFGTSRGVSNVLLQEQAQVFFRQGLLLCIINRDVV